MKDEGLSGFSIPNFLAYFGDLKCTFCNLICHLFNYSNIGENVKTKRHIFFYWLWHIKNDNKPPVGVKALHKAK